jgi:release factor glutamine methyltransferase
MPDSDSPVAASVVQRLRAAGCVFAEDEARLLVAQARTAAELEAMIGCRTAGEPLEFILGWAEFRGLRIEVDHGVFVPRSRSAFLVDQAVAVTRQETIVVDMCCGSGAIGVALATETGPVQLHAVDIDPAATRCAERNVAAIGGQVHLGDLFAPLPAALRGRVDVIVANAPYVPTEAIRQLPPEARDHEPRVALDGGVDGLDVQRRIAAGAIHWLAPGGHLLVETSDRQAAESRSILLRRGFTAHVARSEDLGATVAIGRGPGALES